ncbi:MULTISPECIES: helix-turn-helix domain-containing protein [unclassified Nocardia]|uniref:helix-turn-helix domain-containing protein n=1 Tax=unclassified Nocardia TaxID=2637762 RepID=UPI001CE415E2|nr:MULTISPECIES: helix-turn-helix transcriptional regulator [unclassified Nocardia]
MTDIDNGDRFIGQQIAAYRKRRGISQQVLADRVGLSRGAIAKYENGERPLDSRAALYSIATALQVSVADLTGHPDDRYLSPTAAFHAAVPAIEVALLAAGHVADDREPAPVAELASEADRALDLRMAGDLSALGQMLPDLLTDCHRRTTTGTEPDRRTAWSALSRAAFATALASKGLGYTSLAWNAAHLTAEAADEIGDRVAVAASEFVYSQVLLAIPNGMPAAYTRASGTADKLQSELTTTAQGSQILGMLHLQSALVSAAQGRDAEAHLAEARDLATRTGNDTDAFRLAFGPANVDIWAMSIALEEGCGGAAIELAANVDPTTIRTQERLARFYIECARGYAMDNRYDEAIAALLRAETVAPQYVRSRTVVRELTGYMLRRARRTLTSGQLGQLAQRVGALAEPTNARTAHLA